MNLLQNPPLSLSPVSSATAGHQSGVARLLWRVQAGLLAAALLLSGALLYSLKPLQLPQGLPFWLAVGLTACVVSLAGVSAWSALRHRVSEGSARADAAEDEALNSMFDPRDHEAAALSDPLLAAAPQVPAPDESQTLPVDRAVPVKVALDFDLSAAAAELAADPNRALVHSKVVFHAAEAAQRGGEVVSKVVSNMEDIATSSRKINEILATIDSIAMQTNILALNAAVQSARARQEGRGSDNVASEVRTLAQRAASAAKEIKTLIHASVEKVESGDRLVRDASTTMDAMVSSVQSVTELVGQISAADGAHGLALAQVDVSVQRLDHLTQQHLGLVEQSTTAAESLRMQAERLQKVVGAFRLLQQTQEAAWEAHTVIHSVRASARADTRPGSLDKHGPPSDWSSF